MFDNSLLGVVIDHFGKNTIIQKADENDSIAYIKVEVSPPFLGWIFQFGNKVKIISPGSVRDEFIEYCKKVMENY